MLLDYFILGLNPDVSDKDIRNQYLELVKKYTPEKNSLRFQDVTESYERIKSKRQAIKSRLLGVFEFSDPESELNALGRSVHITRRRVGLSELLEEIRLRNGNEKQ